MSQIGFGCAIKQDILQYLGSGQWLQTGTSGPKLKGKVSFRTAVRPHFRTHHIRKIDEKGTEGYSMADSTAILGRCGCCLQGLREPRELIGRGVPVLSGCEAEAAPKEGQIVLKRGFCPCALEY